MKLGVIAVLALQGCSTCVALYCEKVVEAPVPNGVNIDTEGLVAEVLVGGTSIGSCAFGPEAAPCSALHEALPEVVYIQVDPGDRPPLDDSPAQMQWRVGEEVVETEDGTIMWEPETWTCKPPQVDAYCLTGAFER